MKVVVLAGGTGGAKLARGMLDLAGEQLTVVANTGDDIEIHGVHVSPDPDLVAYWLADEIDEERGWGLRGDSFHAFERLVELGSPEWFALGDRDLALCLRRTELLRAGARLTEAQAAVVGALGVPAKVLPMTDDPVETRVRTSAGWRSFEEYLILDRSEPAVEAYEFQGAAEASPTPEVLAALAEADVVVIGPSNPIASIGPILALPGLRAAMERASAPVLAVSPFVGGRTVKGPTEQFMRAAGLDPSTAGVTAFYHGLIDGLVADSDDSEGLPRELTVRACPTLMSDQATRRRLAEEVLELASRLA